ncbi:MAG TPA: hypothetical protein VMZ53_05325, partial [Kofleriaceae bacterium]|nr:hypothetical protein [Kofleriaceae bacterium]
MRAVLFAVLFTFGCSSNKENANPSPSASAPTSDRRADDRATEAEESRHVAKVEAATAKEAADVKLTAAHDETAARLQKE